MEKRVKACGNYDRERERERERAGNLVEGKR